MSTPSAPVVRTKHRNLAELYLRAYWKTYGLAAGWVVAIEVLSRTVAWK